MWPLVLLLLAEGSLGTADDTDTVEHRVTWDQALARLDHLNLTDLMGEGCKPCTARQTGYCRSDDLVMDHCICDHRHTERLSYVEHTCYVPRRIHPTFAADCLEYVRLVECCCHAALLPLMKEKASSGSRTTARLASLLLPVVMALRWTSVLHTSTSPAPSPS